MLKFIAKTINIGAGIYFSYLVGSTIYEMGKAAGRNESAAPTADNEPGSGNVDYGDYKMVDGVLYQKVDPKA